MFVGGAAGFVGGAAGGGLGGLYWGFCVKVADGRVGVTVRRLVGIDAIVCQFLCCNFAVNATTDISIMDFKWVSMFSYDSGYINKL